MITEFTHANTNGRRMPSGDELEGSGVLAQAGSRNCSKRTSGANSQRNDVTAGETAPITTAELKRAFFRCGLWRLGWTYDRAIGVPLVAWGLHKSALAARRAAPNTPRQLDLTETMP